jgi:hypothetical protein
MAAIGNSADLEEGPRLGLLRSLVMILSVAGGWVLSRCGGLVVAGIGADL